MMKINLAEVHHFHDADDSKGSPMQPGKYKQCSGRFPEVILGFKKGKNKE